MRPDTHMYRPAATSRKTARGNRFAAPASGLLAALLLLAACSDGGTGPDTRVGSVEVAPATKSLVIGQSTALHAVVKNRAGEPLEGREVTWSSSNPSVADVSDDGEVEALAIGLATITASSEGVTGRARIQVTLPAAVPVARVEVAPTSLALPKYRSHPLEAKAFDAAGNELQGRAFSWSVENTDIAQVDESGVVTAKNVGSTRVYASAEGRSGVLHLTVDRAPVDRVTLAPVAPELERGEVVRLVVRLEDEKGLELGDRVVAWSSTDSRALFVDGDGNVYALAEGVATITATSEGKSASVDLRSVAPPASDLLFDRPTSTGGAEIYLLELGYPSTPVKLNAGNVSRDPSPSPDGQRYVFAVSQYDQGTARHINDLYVVNVNGTGMRRLTALPGVEEEPAWSPDGTRIAFSATDETGATDVWVVNADGTGLTNLTSGLGAWNAEHAPAWSPDGERIAFATTSMGIYGSIWTVHTVTGELARLVTDLNHGMHPTWSPDGERIAFHYYAGVSTETDIAIAPASGGATTKLVLAGEQSAPAWSPDGTLLAYTGRDAHGVEQVWTIRPDGTGARMRTGAGRNPSWIDR